MIVLIPVMFGQSGSFEFAVKCMANTPKDAIMRLGKNFRTLYTAPEQVDTSLSWASDVFSAGMVLLALWIPIESESPENVIDKIRDTLKASRDGLHARPKFGLDGFLPPESRPGSQQSRGGSRQGSRQGRPTSQQSRTGLREDSPTESRGNSRPGSRETNNVNDLANLGIGRGIGTLLSSMTSINVATRPSSNSALMSLTETLELESGVQGAVPASHGHSNLQLTPVKQTRASMLNTIHSHNNLQQNMLNISDSKLYNSLPYTSLPTFFSAENGDNFTLEHSNSADGSILLPKISPKNNCNAGIGDTSKISRLEMRNLRSQAARIEATQKLQRIYLSKHVMPTRSLPQRDFALEANHDNLGIRR